MSGPNWANIQAIRSAAEDPMEKIKRAILLYQKKKEMDRMYGGGEEGMTKENLLQMLMGTKQPSEVFGEEAMQPYTPQVLGQKAGGGMVGTPGGATAAGGRIFGQRGQPMGEYAPGFEPTPSPDIANQLAAQQLRERIGTTPQAAMRKFAGFGAKKEIPEGYKESLANAVKAIEEGKDVFKVYQKMASEFPARSAELKRILIRSAKVGELDVSDLLWGEK